MDTSIDNGNEAALHQACPGRFTRVSVQTQAGEIEARLSELGNWELRVRRDDEAAWRLACMGDVNGGAAASEPVVAAAEETVIELGALRIEPARRRARVDEVELALSRKEFALLRVLAGQPSRVFFKEELFEDIWGYPQGKTRTLDSHASKLRRKLRSAGADGLIVNCHGVGYRLWDDPSAAPQAGGAR